MSQADYTHVGDPSGTPTDDLLFTAVSSGSAGNLVSLGITSSTDPLDVGITVTGTEISMVALRSGGDATHADSTYLTSAAAALNANAQVAALVSVSVINTTPGATLWTTVSGPVLLSGGTPIEAEADITVDITPDPPVTAVPYLIHGASGDIAPSVSMEAEAMLILGGTGYIAPSVSVAANGGLVFTGAGSIVVDVSMTATAQMIAGASAVIRPEISMTASASILRTGTTVCDVVRDILAQWGLELPCKAPQFARMAAVDTLNQAMQTVWNQAKDRRHWTRQTVTVTYPADATELKLTDTIQNVIGHVRSAGRTLVPLGNRHEAENFEAVFGESADNPPTAYFIDTSAQSGADPCRVSLMLRPIPSTERTVDVDAVLECPRYTTLDLESCPVVPIPHRYVESLLMPVARYLSMQNRLFANEENRQSIEQGFAIASEAMDQSDPTTTTARKGGNDERR